jgi:hypothetical protein
MLQKLLFKRFARRLIRVRQERARVGQVKSTQCPLCNLKEWKEKVVYLTYPKDRKSCYDFTVKAEEEAIFDPIGQNDSAALLSDARLGKPIFS